MLPFSDLILSKLNTERTIGNIFKNVGRDSSTVSTFIHLL